jgi:hypothetical protein
MSVMAATLSDWPGGQDALNRANSRSIKLVTDAANTAPMEHSQHLAPLRRPFHYDAVRRRLWICGQRCHHGATGALLTGVAAAALFVSPASTRRAVTLAATGWLLMVHDWKDRPHWFERGFGSQS